MMLNRALRLLRIYHELNQKELAELLEVSAPYVSEIETGAKTPSFETIEKYSKVFEIPASSIMFFAEQIENPDGSVSESDNLQKFIAEKIIKFLSFIEMRAKLGQ